MAAAMGGDMAAFADIYRRYREPIRQFVWRRTHDDYLAEDLTSETFTRALKRRAWTFVGKDPAAWLFSIAGNLLRDYYKSAHRRLSIPTGEPADLDRADDDYTDRLVLAQLDNAALAAALERMLPDQRRCLVLRFLADYSVAETAKVMGRNEGAIKALTYRALRALAQLVPQDLNPKETP